MKTTIRKIPMVTMKRLAGAGLLALLLAGRPDNASATVNLVRAKPAQGATVPAPNQLDLWFNESLKDGVNAVAIMPAEELKLNPKERIDLTRSSAVLDAKDPRHLRVEVEPLPAGDYVVEWRVVAPDGSKSPGHFDFHVAEPPR